MEHSLPQEEIYALLPYFSFANDKKDILVASITSTLPIGWKTFRLYRYLFLEIVG